MHHHPSLTMLVLLAALISSNGFAPRPSRAPSGTYVEPTLSRKSDNAPDINTKNNKREITSLPSTLTDDDDGENKRQTTSLPSTLTTGDSDNTIEPSTANHQGGNDLISFLSSSFPKPLYDPSTIQQVDSTILLRASLLTVFEERLGAAPQEQGWTDVAEKIVRTAQRSEHDDVLVANLDSIVTSLAASGFTASDIAHILYNHATIPAANNLNVSSSAKFFLQTLNLRRYEYRKLVRDDPLTYLSAKGVLRYRACREILLGVGFSGKSLRREVGEDGLIGRDPEKLVKLAVFLSWDAIEMTRSEVGGVFRRGGMLLDWLEKSKNDKNIGFKN